MQFKELNVNGKTAIGYEIDLPNAKLVLVVAQKGYIMCGYLSPEAADKFNDCAAIVKGVKSIDEILLKSVSWVSNSAADAGIIAGMSGFEALTRMF